MAQLISASTEQVGAPLQAGYPQVMTIVQEFDRSVVPSDEFALVFYGKSFTTENFRQDGEMTAKPVQFLPNQLVYTLQVSPFARGKLGVKRKVGSLTDVYGSEVDLKIGTDFDIYNTEMKAYFGNSRLQSNWDIRVPWPASAVCPDNTPPTSFVQIGPWTTPLGVPDEMWNGGNFYYWVNIAFKPDNITDGLPFVWEPPFHYAYSGYGFPVINTTSSTVPPWAGTATDTILYNICSSGAGSQGYYDTCGWIEDHPVWRGRVQWWCFGSDLFNSGTVPWQYPAVADPTGDLSPYSVFAFPPSMPEQFFLQQEFTYVTP
jgi:hypothetical protein